MAEEKVTATTDVHASNRVKTLLVYPEFPAGRRRKLKKRLKERSWLRWFDRESVSRFSPYFSRRTLRYEEQARGGGLGILPT
jgi:hypothetical protein